MQVLLTPDAAPGAAAVQQRLVAELSAGKRVLWFVPGGSSIPLCVTIMANIPDELTPHLTITLTDERFGPVGHPDSNWQQLMDCNFDTKQAQTIPVLTGENAETTVINFATALGQAFEDADTVLGQYGMGPDGHIAGILPDTPGTVTDEGLVVGYTTDTYQRITTTFAAIRHCNAAYLLAFGEAKKPALESLSQDLPLETQPAQILKELSEAYVYNDQIGDPV